MRTLFALLLILLAPVPALAQPTLDSGTVLAAAERLRPGEFLWAPGVAPAGPVLLVISLATQRAVLYRNGVPIAITTVSTGRPGHSTPTGIFTVLQRRVEHYSSLYNNAPMPYMQRLTWGGVALHGGHLPGYPASHGCIRLPHEFARLLYGETHLGMTVVVTRESVLPRVAPAETLLASGAAAPAARSGDIWRPELSPSGPISIVISARDQRAVVLRDGRLIGNIPARVAAPLDRTSVFMVQEGGWIRIRLPGQADPAGAAFAWRDHLVVPDRYRAPLEALLVPGTTVVFTQDALQADRRTRSQDVLESDDSD